MKHLYSLTSLKVLLIVVVMTCSSFARGQSFDYNPYDTVKAKTIHHEFGMSLYSQPNFESLSTFVNLPQNRSIEFVFLLFWYFYDTVASNPDYKFTNSFNFFYKLHWKDYAFRLGYTSNRLTYRNVVDSTYWNANTLGWFKMYSGTYQMQRLSLGCEKNYSLKRFDFYYALDVAYYWGFICGSALQGFGNPDNSYASNIYYSYNYRFNEFGVAPTLGLRFRFWKICALSTEINWNFLYYKAKDTKGFYPTYSQFKVYSNPVSIFAFSMYF